MGHGWEQLLNRVQENQMAQSETKVFTANIPLPLADRVDQIAARLERSQGWVVKQALSAWADLEEERSRLT
ncbi:MAG: ribbon-helix-helix domain-containing protein, partial [Telluria sp.]|nr:ribbon-helix-helix domain-containing protein [Telluria sp.]